MKKPKLLIQILLLTFCINQLRGQGANEILLNCSNAYRTNENLSLKFKVYNRKTDDGVKNLVGEGKIEKAEKCYYSNFDNSETIINNGKFISIDHNRSKIIYSEFDTSKQYRIGTMSALKMDSLLDLSDTIYFVKETSDYWHLNVVQGTGYYKSIELEIRKEDYIIRRIRYNFQDSDNLHRYELYEMEIHYYSIEKSSDNDTIFDISNYLDLTGSKVKPAKSISKYSLNVNTQ